ncbi:hypothetical protein GETHLI_34240 [Geothrix limicola]|uniref:DUF4382 domain-containing protein n=1 Tax=Geothrix limicola TaxID=2927978 RepID=A0ABQ5QJP6_9BACT|nr:DUF4382 domain-containing protein [Geothrix limicola]GLH74922.1 hypothetical protein GETHLI_34240 [Geothrix limicola]
MRVSLFPMALLGLGLALACGGGGSSSQPAPTGKLTIRLGSDSFPGYSQAVVSVEKVEGSTDGSNWMTLGNVKKTYDLMVLQNGHSTVILPATTVSPATYTQFRITWATDNYTSPISKPAYVWPTGAAVGQPLAMPTTTLVNGPVTVAANGDVTAQIMLSGLQPVQFRAGSTAYTFQAVGRALDLAASASITGQVADGSTPLAGAEVFAETVDGVGFATLQRRAFADASGTFVLEGLPTGSLYYVVSQPAASSSTCYGAKASAAVNATSAAAYPTSLAFSAPQTPGSLTLTITPASLATQSTWGELRQTLATGASGSQTLIVRAQAADSGLTQDQAGFLNLAPGTYGVAAQRSTSLAAPVLKAGSQVPVSAGALATTTLSYP